MSKGAAKVAAGEWAIGDWPCLKTYEGARLRCISLPVGGIGTGTVGFGGRGELRDWEIMNVPAKGFSGVGRDAIGDAPFFAIQACGQAARLTGPLFDDEYLHCQGKGSPNYGMPRFTSARFSTSYPYAKVELSGGMPVQAEIRAFNPFIPGDTEASSLPVATFSFIVRNPSDRPVAVSVAGALRNFVGMDGTKRRPCWMGGYEPTGAAGNVNEYVEEGTLKGIRMSSEECPKDDAAWGTMALVTDTEAKVTHRVRGKDGVWYATIEDFWRDFSSDGELEENPPFKAAMPFAALAVRKTVPAHGTATFTFHFTWSFPNRKDWNFKTTVGNHYATVYPDAWDAAKRIVPRLPALERRSRAFVEAFLSTDMPDCLKEAALFNLATLRSQTVFRIPSGHLLGWEGQNDDAGVCQGSCTHVWNYEQATGFLFADLARTMRDVEFNYATRDDGMMMFRADLPLDRAKGEGACTHPAADGQMGTILKVYREWLNCGDDEWLRAIWPKVRLALSFAWARDGKWNWDADEDGLMEGLQHNTMDVNYAGPNPQMEFWYLGALKAASAMARHLGDDAFADKCDRLFANGSKLADSEIFNGEYYFHKINVDPAPDFQLGPGCLVDQLVGQTFARIVGLGDLADPKKTLSAINSVFRYNQVWDFSRFFNPQRAYVLGNERGLLMASWPKGELSVPFPYAYEVMTGFEYAAATEMLYRGMTGEALTVIQQIRNRHDGAKRNPFSEPECGHHYARSMASWGCHLAWSRFHYSAPEGTMSFTAEPGTYFWSNGSAWGTARIGNETVDFKVVEGSLSLKALRLEGLGKPIAKNFRLAAGKTKRIAYGNASSALLRLIPQPTAWEPADGFCDASAKIVRKTVADKDGAFGPEGYALVIEPGRVTATAATATGHFYARQSLEQLKRAYGGKFPCGRIFDKPKYRVRGVMLDVARKPFSMDFLRATAKNLAFYKMNEFHIHLNDDSWSKDQYGYDCYSCFRLESEKFPELTAKDCFYTKKEFRAFCKECAAMGITVVPEFDSPAHSGCFTQYKPAFASDKYGRSHLDLHNPAVLKFMDELLGEYLDGPDPVFPGPWMHVGTDEYNAAESEAFRAYTDAMFKLVRKHGRQPRAWGSLDAMKGKTPVTADAGIAMDIWNNGWYGPNAALKAGYSIVAVPDFNLYIVPGTGYYWDYLDLRWVFNTWEPNQMAYETVDAGDPRLLGGKFAVWNDLIGNGISEDDVHDRMFPAIQVIAQQTWSGLVPGQTYGAFAELAAMIGEAPGVNLADKVEVGADGVVMPGQKAVGWTQEGGWTVEFDLLLDGGQAKDATIFDDGFTLVKVNQGNSGHLGFSRDGYDFTFCWNIPSGAWQHVRLVGTREGTALFVNGAFVQRLQGQRRVFTGRGGLSSPLTQTMHFPLVATPRRFRGEIRNFVARVGAPKKNSLGLIGVM